MTKVKSHSTSNNQRKANKLKTRVHLVILCAIVTLCAKVVCVKSKLTGHDRIESSEDAANEPTTQNSVQFDDTPIDEHSNTDDSNSIDDDEDENELDEDSDQFFNQNPIDQTKSTTAIERDLDRKDPLLSVIQFDDHDSLSTSDFYDSHKIPSDPTKSLNQTQGRKFRSNSASRQASASNNVNRGAQAEQLSCALILARGVCITFRSLESAISRARDDLDLDLSREALESSEPREETINAVAELTEATTRQLAVRYQLSWSEIAFELPQIDTSRTSLWRLCPLIFRSMPTCPVFSRYRSHTGQCNNLMATHLGSANMPFLRLLPAEYADGIGAIARRSSISGGSLPPARLVVLNLHPSLENPSLGQSTLFMSWGQLVNHDLAMASTARGSTGHGDSCCPNLRARGLCMPIEISPMDPLYSQVGLRCHEFKRSLAGLRPGCSLGPRTQLNTITSYLDVSFVYGSSRSMMNSLRQSERGLLEMWNLFGRQGLKPMLPAQRSNPNEGCVGRSASSGRPFCFRSGDIRTNQHVQLVALHTIHARQHNRLALALGQMNPHWSDNRIYHEARHIHIAIVQHILLNEYLPILLGPKQCQKYNLTEAPLGSYWDYYNPSLNPGISQAFAAAAFRQGHTRVPSLVYRFNAFHEPLRVYPLRDLFQQPWPLFEPGALDQFLLGMVDTQAESFDPFISLELSGHLLKMPNERVGLDLAAINIQRGRDQGLAGYNAYREWCGLGGAKSFDDLLKDINRQSVNAMSSLYESVDDIDLFSGGISEYPLRGAQVGPTFACIIGRQFEILRAADRFWFESSIGPHSFTLAQLDSIKQVTLSRLICANSDTVSTIQVMAMQQAHPILNPMSHCSSIPDLDITLWHEPVAINIANG